MLGLIDTLVDMREGRLSLGPIVVMSQRRLTLAQRETFEMGLEAGARGWRAPERPQERHLRSV